MATQLQTVNKILRRLRESTVSTVNENDYSILLGQFINDAKADMEDINYEWSMYEQVKDISILDDGTRIYEVPDTDSRSWLQRVFQQDRLPMAFDITSPGPFAQLCDVPLKTLHRIRGLDADVADDQARPQTFAMTYNNTNEGWDLVLLYGSNEARTWRTYWYIPQPELELDGSDDNTVIQLPERPVFMRALYYALNERGEEMGANGGLAFERSDFAIAAALENDMMVQKKSAEITITNNESLGTSIYGEAFYNVYYGA